jgi:hypothetical protein
VGSGHHQEVKKAAADEPDTSPRCHLNRSLVWNTRANAVQEEHLDIVAAEREPKGEDRGGQEQRQTVGSGGNPGANCHSDRNVAG